VRRRLHRAGGRTGEREADGEGVRDARPCSQLPAVGGAGNLQLRVRNVWQNS